MTKPNVAILDTNILKYGVTKDLNIEVADLLTTLSQNYGLVISGYQLFEIYRGLRKDKISITQKLLAPITPLTVDIDTFRIAAALYSCYQHNSATKNGNGETKSHFNDSGDIIIAATAIRYGTAILTANGNDFPRPFFDESKKFTLTRRNNRAEIAVNLLVPDIKTFNATMRVCLL